MDDDALILDAVEKFCLKHLPDAELRRRDEEHLAYYDMVPELAEMGLIRAGFPVEWGGLGLPWATICRVQEKLAYHCYSVSSLINRYISFGGLPILHFGTEEQKRRLLPEILAGRRLIALALSEPQAGSDARAVTTRATADGAGWTISGRKTWISDADFSDYHLALCRTPEHGDRSLTAFLIPRNASGVSMTPLRKVGNNSMPSWDIGYDEVRVSDADRLGDVGKGFATISGTLKYSRASVSAATLGTAQAALDLAIDHARNRIQFGQQLTGFQVLRHRLVDMHVEIQKAKLVVAELARRIDQGEPAEEIGAISKISSTECLQFVTNHGMQILASAGYTAESAMQRYWRDARLYTFGEGTNEIQREITAKQLHLYTGKHPAQ